MTLPTDYLNATSSWNTHPDAHNDTNAAVNDLLARVTALEGGGGGGALTLLAENLTGGLVSWTDTAGHDHPSDITVPCVENVPILFQFNVGLRWGSATSGQLTVVSDGPVYGTHGGFSPYHLYHESRLAGQYIERTLWASIIPEDTGTITAHLNFQLAGAATSGNHELDSSDDVFMRAFG